MINKGLPYARPFLLPDQLASPPLFPAPAHRNVNVEAVIPAEKNVGRNLALRCGIGRSEVPGHKRKSENKAPIFGGGGEKLGFVLGLEEVFGALGSQALAFPRVPNSRPDLYRAAIVRTMR